AAGPDCSDPRSRTALPRGVSPPNEPWAPSREGAADESRKSAAVAPWLRGHRDRSCARGGRGRSQADHHGDARAADADSPLLGRLQPVGEAGPGAPRLEAHPRAAETPIAMCDVLPRGEPLLPRHSALPAMIRAADRGPR